jgi:hypothetical protein
MLIYLASPYSDDEPAVMEHRYDAVCALAASLTRKGHMVWSPIAHGHSLARFGLPKDAAYWERFNTRCIQACDEVWIAKMTGWDESKGIAREIEMAKELGKVVRYL